VFIVYLALNVSQFFFYYLKINNLIENEISHLKLTVELIIP